MGIRAGLPPFINLNLRELPRIVTPNPFACAACAAILEDVFDAAASNNPPSIFWVNPVCCGGNPVATICPAEFTVVGAKLAILIYCMEIMSSLSSLQIQALVRDMDESLRKHKKIKTTHPDIWRKLIVKENERLYTEFPTIFEKHIEGKLDETFFYMLQMRRKIETGEMTEHDASVAVGQKLFNRFVAPVVENAPAQKPLSYEEYYKQYASIEETKKGDV